MKRYFDFVSESKNNEIISDIKDIMLEITDLNLRVNYFYYNNHINVFLTDKFNKIIIHINSQQYSEPFKINNTIIDTINRIDDFLKINDMSLYLSFNDRDREYKSNSILNFKDKYLKHLYLIVEFNNINENLEFTKSSDFKNRWGIEGELSIDDIYKYFDLFRDSLLELEDDGIIKKYTLSYLKKGISHNRIEIKIDDKNIESKIEDFTNVVREKASLRGDISGDLSIHTQFMLPIGDVTDIMSSIIDCVKFIKDNIEDNGECLLVPMSSTPNSFKIILNIKL